MGGLDVRAGSNIVWSNGGYDPWHVAGVLESASETNVAVWIPEGAHHVDTMFRWGAQEEAKEEGGSGWDN
jgi:hypothetical protein